MTKHPKRLVGSPRPTFPIEAIIAKLRERARKVHDELLERGPSEASTAQDAAADEIECAALELLRIGGTVGTPKSAVVPSLKALRREESVVLRAIEIAI